MDMLNVKINGISVSVEKGSTILDAARAAGVEIPTLCFMKEKNEIGACRICVVEANEGRGFRIVTACVYPVSEGMEVLTNTEKIQKARRTTLELILSTHEKKCLSCVRSTNCELQKLCRDYGVEESAFEGFKPTYELDTSTPHLVRDNNKCVLCRRCVAACNEQYVGVIGANNRGIDTAIGTPFEVGLSNVPCISCGQCTVVCPTGALVEKDDTDKIWAALADPDKHVVVQTAPSIRATLGECFGMPIGTNVEGKMVAALRRLGFDKIFDTDFAADLTIVEEANELVERIKNNGTLPMITSCSPGWVKFCEYYYPDMLEHLSTCKSPQQMAGAVIKTYYADKMGIDPKDIVSVSVMPCTAKKFEIGREDQSAAGVPDVDIAITTRELSRMIMRAGISFTNLPDEEFDSPLGEDTGAAVIFGATGGGVEALRTLIKGKLVAFTGNSGVGKSSILNRLAPELRLSTGEVSEKLGRGRHTTRHVELYSLGDDTFVMDTPGFSSFDTDEMDVILKENLQYAFADFGAYLGKCRFDDCTHRKEPGCAVREACGEGKIEKTRYESYLKLYEKASQVKAWELK